MSDTDLVHHLIEELRNLSSQVSNMRVEVGELKKELELRNTCPTPGACTDLRGELKAIRDQVAAHDKLVSRMEGGWKTLVVLCSVCSALGGVIGWAFSTFGK